MVLKLCFSDWFDKITYFEKVLESWGPERKSLSSFGRIPELIHNMFIYVHLFVNYCSPKLTRQKQVNCCGSKSKEQGIRFTWMTMGPAFSCGGLKHLRRLAAAAWSPPLRERRRFTGSFNIIELNKTFILPATFVWPCENIILSVC